MGQTAVFQLLKKKWTFFLCVYLCEEFLLNRHLEVLLLYYKVLIVSTSWVYLSSKRVVIPIMLSQGLY